MSDIEVRHRILVKSEEMFMKFGYGSVTMEAIASELAISKKTLYKHFSNKEHIHKELVYSIKCEITEFVEKLIENESIEFIDKLKQFMNFIAAQSSKLEGPLVRDMMRNHPEVWQDIQQFRKLKAHNNLSRLIEQGVTKGVFRKDINIEVVVLAYVAAIHSLVNPEVLAQISVSADEAFREVINILFNGIFSSEGREKYSSTIINKEIMEK